MHYIYSRVSTDVQTTENQLHALKLKYPHAEIISETISGTKAQKPILEALLVRLQRGDALVISSLDRLGRTAWRAIKLIDELYDRGITVISIREGVDYSTSTGRMIAGIMLNVSQMERDLISERTKTALARLKAEGRYIGRPRGVKNRPDHKPLGRPKSFDMGLAEIVYKNRMAGMKVSAIAEMLNRTPSWVSKAMRMKRRADLIASELHLGLSSAQCEEY